MKNLLDQTGENKAKAPEETSQAVPLENYKRLAADFENYRRQAEARLSSAKEAGRAGLLRDLLSVLDDLDSALGHYADNKEVCGGLEGIRKKMLDALSANGLEQMACCEGERFDPEVHEAVKSVESKEEGRILSELRKGYKFNSAILRHPMVVVGVATAGKNSPNDAKPAQAGNSEKNNAKTGGLQ